MFSRVYVVFIIPQYIFGHELIHCVSTSMSHLHVADNVTSFLFSWAVDYFHSLPADFAAMCLSDNEQ